MTSILATRGQFGTVDRDGYCCHTVPIFEAFLSGFRFDGPFAITLRSKFLPPRSGWPDLPGFHPLSSGLFPKSTTPDALPEILSARHTPSARTAYLLHLSVASQWLD